MLQMTNEEKEKIAFWKRKFPKGTKFDSHFHDRGTWSEDEQKEYCFSIEVQRGYEKYSPCLIIADFVTFEG